jgi:hypothetical protein
MLAAVLVDALCCGFQKWLVVAHSLIVGDGAAGNAERCILGLDTGLATG